MTVGDILLTWISEIGSGTIADFRARAAWLARTANLDLHESATGRWLRDAASLGHCEVDWKNGKWSIAPTVVSRLPLADGLAILTGLRRPRLVQAIERGDIFIERATRAGSDRDIPAPSTILIPFGRASELEEIADAIGATYSGCAAVEIARLLPRTALAHAAAPPAFDSPLERLTGFSPPNWVAASPRDRTPQEGLYREQIHGRWNHLVRRDGSWYSVDLSSGIFFELARRGENVIRWRPDTEDRTRSGTAIVDWGAPIPPLHARALVLCSGFVPRFGDNAETVLYDNVPRDVAARVATSLDQTLHIFN